jgi:FkbM family methyltransferase
MASRLRQKLSKGIFSLTHPACWPALLRRVAPGIEHRELLAGLDCDLLLDVGANRGQFSLIARIVHPRLRIHAFEPQPGEAAVYREIFGGDGSVTLHEVALGDQPGEADLHLSQRRDSSSLLPIGELQEKLFPSTGEVGTHRVKVVTLDSQSPLWRESNRILLKLDVQGFELGVLRGAREALRQCAYVYAECSEIPLYTGQALYPEVAAFLAGEGFQPLQRINEQFDQGRLIQADHLFGRTPGR